MSHDPDVFLYSGPIAPGGDERLIDLCASIPQRSDRALLCLATYGGDPDVAYRIARTLQRNYSRVAILVDGPCKSAGTLLALGGEELILTDHGEMGPLDIQIQKEDELIGSQSGLTPSNALDWLATTSTLQFDRHFLHLKLDMNLTTKLAAEVAGTVTVGLMKEIYGQIDPIRIGEIDRMMAIAQEYGSRLTAARGNAVDGAISRLVMGYPAHSFVIDREEAGTLFKIVREPTDTEWQLIDSIGDPLRDPARATRVEILSQGVTLQEPANSAEDQDGQAGYPNGNGSDPAGAGSEVSGTGATGDGGNSTPPPAASSE